MNKAGLRSAEGVIEACGPLPVAAKGDRRAQRNCRCAAVHGTRPDTKDEYDMADDNDVLTDLDNLGPLPGADPQGQDPLAGANGEDNLPVAGIVSQYVKDLSVENPKAPESFGWRDQPQMAVQFNIGARPVNDELSEVELKITATAKTAQGAAYIVDLAYCGLVGMRNMPEEQKHAFTYAEAPRLLFPYARRVVADAVRDAGFAPLMLDPIDFNGLYIQNLENQRAQQVAGEGAPQTAPGGEG